MHLQLIKQTNCWKCDPLAFTGSNDDDFIFIMTKHEVLHALVSQVIIIINGSMYSMHTNLGIF